MSVILNRDVYAPSAYLARGMESFLIYAKNEQDPFLYWTNGLTAKFLGLAVFPLVLASEFMAEPFFLAKDVIAYQLGVKSGLENLVSTISRIKKLALGILCTPLSIMAADAVSYLFLQKTFVDNHIAPFGVEKLYGITTQKSIQKPGTVEEVREIVLKAKEEKRKISIIGSGMSQGEQIVPVDVNDMVIELSKLNSVKFIENGQNNLVKVGAGATWEEVLLKINKRGASIIVKQASDIFSVGGSIGINCHGWEHASGAIASTVESLEIIDAEGNLRFLSREKDPELFGCMFGTLGYFGVIVSATLRVSDNIELKEKAEPCPIEDFHERYVKDFKKDPNKPLLIGRLNINKNPLQTLYVNTFEATDKKERLITSDLKLESVRGERIERIFLNALGHLPDYLYAKLADVFWNREVKIMTKEQKQASRNEIMHFGIKSFFQLHQSDLYTQWLQEFFVAEENLPDFLKFLGEILEKNGVRLLNASIRPTPKDEISILPYAEKNRYAIVISFHQLKTKKQIEKTRKWIEEVQEHLLEKGDKWYQAYMPYATQEQFERCYGMEMVDKMRDLKKKHDKDNLFSNRHTVKYFDKKEGIE